MNDAQIALELGDEYPYELNPGDNLTSPDWAHRAARGVMADLNDRSGIKHELRGVRMDDRKDIVAALAAIIRLAHSEANVKEHATLPAGASVDHEVEVEGRQGHENRAADRGCVSRLP